MWVGFLILKRQKDLFSQFILRLFSNCWRFTFFISHQSSSAFYGLTLSRPNFRAVLFMGSFVKNSWWGCRRKRSVCANPKFESAFNLVGLQALEQSGEHVLRDVKMPICQMSPYNWLLLGHCWESILYHESKSDFLIFSPLLCSSLKPWSHEPTAFMGWLKIPFGLRICPQAWGALSSKNRFFLPTPPLMTMRLYWGASLGSVIYSSAFRWGVCMCVGANVCACTCKHTHSRVLFPSCPF